ncbi:hypothetical protein RIF29_36200 [Crotalaria pallida]|uniref:Uncharacterized protein n=1 Tax=Crotalaria pallida TaxID=3830 RepID=A0AAN9HS65_CROPI
MTDFKKVPFTTTSSLPATTCSLHSAVSPSLVRAASATPFNHRESATFRTSPPRQKPPLFFTVPANEPATHAAGNPCL